MRLLQAISALDGTATAAAAATAVSLWESINRRGPFWRTGLLPFCSFSFELLMLAKGRQLACYLSGCIWKLKSTPDRLLFTRVMRSNALFVVEVQLAASLHSQSSSNIADNMLPL
jgi:hypothetical protein